MVDGVAIGPEGERIAIEVKSPRDDILRGIGQCDEALAAGCSRAVLVTTLRVARKLRKRVFRRRGVKLDFVFGTDLPRPPGVDSIDIVFRIVGNGWFKDETAIIRLEH